MSGQALACGRGWRVGCLAPLVRAKILILSTKLHLTVGEKTFALAAIIFATEKWREKRKRKRKVFKQRIILSIDFQFIYAMPHLAEHRLNADEPIAMPSILRIFMNI